jgi:hypothetical protein
VLSADASAVRGGGGAGLGEVHPTVFCDLTCLEWRSRLEDCCNPWGVVSISQPCPSKPQRTAIETLLKPLLGFMVQAEGVGPGGWQPRSGGTTDGLAPPGALQVSFLGDAKISLGDAKSSLGDAESSLGDANSSLGDANSSLGDAKSSLGDAESSLGDAKSSLGDAKS